MQYIYTSKVRQTTGDVFIQRIDLVQVQNVIARITHGLIGFDLRLQGKESEQYFGDFLSLTEKELRSALESASAAASFAPLPYKVTIDQGPEVISSVRNAQRLVREENISRETIQRTISELEEKLNCLYCGMIHP